MSMDRRDSLRSSALAGGALLAGPAGATVANESPRDGNPAVAPQASRHKLPDLTPARWILTDALQAGQTTCRRARRQW